MPERTLCPYCGVGCGLTVRTEAGRVTEVAGDPDHPVNRGRTCAKPLELAAAVHAPDRLLTPLHREGPAGGRRAIGWDAAASQVAARLAAILAEHGPDAIGFHISGQLLTEDYYVVNKLAKGFLGTNHVDSNSRLCMSSAVAGYSGAFAFDGPPTNYADIEAADCLLLLGSNAAACHPILFGRIRERQRAGATVICVDPRRTPTAEAADLHLPVRPGTDLALLNALLCVLAEEGLLDTAFLAEHVLGFEAVLKVAREWPAARAAEVCGIGVEAIVEAANRFGSAGAALALWSMGANQSTVGTLKNRALINLCLATGNLGRPGAGPFSLTGQPNAMGGREVGGLAHLLPGYRRIDDPAARRAVAHAWGVRALNPTPGLAAVDMFEAATTGRIRALWIVATNPVVSMPDAALVRAALERAELVIVQDAHHPTETSMLADYVLPAAAWPEKQGTMTNSERRVGLVRRLLDPPGEARPDWRIFADVAAHLGHGEAFAWPDEAAVYDEYAALTAGRPNDVSGLTHSRLARSGQGVQWPCPAPGHPGTPRLYLDGVVPGWSDGRARALATPHVAPAEAPDARFGLTLTTGRVASQWHTMTRTAHSARLRAATPHGPELEIHPDDAAAAGVRDGERALVRSRRGEFAARVRITDRIRPGTVFAPFGWGALHAAPGDGAVNATSHRHRDPTSGQPELKAIPVAVLPLGPRPPVRSVHAQTRSRLTRRVVVIGTGMAGTAVAEAVVRRRPAAEWQVTLIGAEPDRPYHRISVSKLLAGAVSASELELHPPEWYASAAVRLLTGSPATSVDLAARTVIDARGGVHPYDALVFATGSRPFVPPVPGADAAHVHAFRTVGDVERLLGALRAGARRAVVIGGGLLGLEAAAGLLARGAAVTVVERGDRLMPQQLDAGAATLLARALADRGMGIETDCAVAAIEPDAVRFDDGRRLLADLVVMAAGVVPDVALASASGLTCGRGIVVDDELRTSAPDVFAVGECAEHAGRVHGLWAPLAEQARVAGAVIVGDPAGFRVTPTATSLKVGGIDLLAGGQVAPGPGGDEVVVASTRAGRYRRLLLDGDRLVGAILLGDLTGAGEIRDRLSSGAPLDDAVLVRLSGGTDAPADPDPDGLVCACQQVRRSTLAEAIRSGRAHTVTALGELTGAGTGCGGCRTELAALCSSARNTPETTVTSAQETLLT